MLRHLTLFFFLMIFSTISGTASGFEDNFDDGDMAGWSFDGMNPGPWSEAFGEMQIASIQTGHVPVADDSPGVDLISEIVIFSDGFEGLGEGSVCTENSQCASGLLCCYPCGIAGCENQCTVPVNEICPAYP